MEFSPPCTRLVLFVEVRSILLALTVVYPRGATCVRPDTAKRLSVSADELNLYYTWATRSTRNDAELNAHLDALGCWLCRVFDAGCWNSRYFNT